jgi:hypothetical protein
VQSFDSPGQGFQAFTDVEWNGVPLDPVNTHTLRFFAPAGRVNLCSVSVALSEDVDPGPSNPPNPSGGFVVPFTANALSFSDFFEVSAKKWGNCDTGTIVDAEFTNDAACQSIGLCNIAYVENGEWLEYDFSTNTVDISPFSDGTEGVLVNITARVASYSSTKTFVSTYSEYKE